MRLAFSGFSLLIAALVAPASASFAADALNIYSARHYEADDLLYDGFEEATGISVNVIEGEGPELLARMRAEGKNSPADLFLTVDAGNLWLAEKENLFQPVQSGVLASRIPESLRNPKNLWFGFSTRARMIFVNASRVDPKLVQTYESLADPRLKGKICMRSSSAIYNLSLMGALIEHWGPEKAEQWARGVVSNFARPPQGADTTLLQSVAAGECAITLANHYYFVRLQTSRVRGEQESATKLTPIFPDQEGRGTHVNISGAGILASAPHRESAVKFLEYMASDKAQDIVANANYEFPVVGTTARSRELSALGEFKIDLLNVATYGVNQARAQAIFDRAGWR